MKKMFVFSTGFWGASIAVVFLLLLIFFPLFGLVQVIIYHDFGAYYFLIMGFVAFFSGGFAIYRDGKDLYSLYIFDDEKILVKGLFFKQYSLHYEKMSSIEIASYVHGVLNSSIGSKHHYICFSYDKFDPRYRNQINRWKTNKRSIKVECTTKLCAFLLDVLPSRQCNKLLVSKNQSDLKEG